MNPTRERLFEVLRLTTDLVPYGPGFNTTDELEAGAERFIERTGPYDFVVTDEYVLQEFDLTQPEKIRFVNHACYFDPTLLRVALAWRAFFEHYEGVRVITLLQSDFYNFTATHIERLLAMGDYFVAWGPELMTEKTQALPRQPIENGIDEAIVEKWSDNYLQFAKTHRNRLIVCPHFVGEREFCDKPLQHRRREWSVLGAGYDARVLVRAAFDRAGVRWAGDGFRFIHEISQRLSLNLYAHVWSIDLLQYLARSVLRNTKHSYTCGSVLAWPIRKFFEIPAAGCVLVCAPPVGFSALGFVDRDSALLSRPEDVMDAMTWLADRPEEAQSIANRGRELVRLRHSVTARANQIGEAFRRIVSGQFFGSQWSAGEFQFLPPRKSTQ